MIYILMNPLANNRKGIEAADKAKKLFEGQQTKIIDVRQMMDPVDFIRKMAVSDIIIIAGGDGTVNRFINDTYGLNIQQTIYLFPSGSGNDFAHDLLDNVEAKNNLYPLNDLIKDLPYVLVKGRRKYFVNGIGFGLDGYCCEKGDEWRESKSEKPINYASIAIKGMLGKFHPSKAKVTVDGVVKEFKHVWLAPTMFGRYYGGGMMITPYQDRRNPKKTVTAAICHSPFALAVLIAFPKLFKGTHVNSRLFNFFEGHQITIEFDKPQSAQIDGETVKDVYSYTVRYPTERNENLEQ